MIDLDKQGSNKLQFTTNAPASPHKCASCQWSATEPGRYYMDMGVDVDYYGVVYLCTLCLNEAIKLLGLVNPGTLSEENEALKKENALLKGIVEDINGIVPDLDLISRAVRRFISRSWIDSSDSEQILSESLNSTGQSDSDSAGVEREIDELINGSGSASVLDSTGDGKSGLSI